MALTRADIAEEVQRELGIPKSQSYDLVELLLRFLESNGLIDFTLRNKTFLSIMKLHSSMERIVGRAMHHEDFLINELKTAWNDPDI